MLSRLPQLSETRRAETALGNWHRCPSVDTDLPSPEGGGDTEMCGRARCTVRVDAVAAACGFQAPLRSINADRYQPSYNVAPGTHMPVVRYDSTGNVREPVVHCMRWGLVPSFTKKSERPDFYRMFNARSESIHQKASFRRLLPKNRCLVTVEGFYEWKKDGKKKQPYYVHIEDEHLLVFAALYDSWEGSEGENLFTFTILTTRVSKRLEWLHDRMPVVLRNQDAIMSWMNDDLSEDIICKLTQPYEASDLVWYAVTPAMGRPVFNGPECVEEVKPKVAGESKIAQMFGKQIGQDVSRHSDEVIRGEPSPNEDERKALLAGAEPDQDVTEALQHSEENLVLDGTTRDEKQSNIPQQDGQNCGSLKASPKKDDDTQNSSPWLTSQSEGSFSLEPSEGHILNKEHVSKARQHEEKTESLLSSTTKVQGRKAVADAKQDSSKRRRTNISKNTPEKVKPTGVKQKQSNLLGFFSVK